MVTIEIPEDGQIASFTRQGPVQDLGHRPRGRPTTGGGIDCGDVTVNISLGHDEHAHELSPATGLRGHVRDRPDRRPRRRRPTPSRSSRSPTPTRAARRHRRADRPRAGDPAAQAKQAEFFADHRPRARDATDRRRRACRRRRPPTPGAAAEHRLHRGRRLRLLQAVQPRGHLDRALPRGLGRRRRHDRGALRLADGTLVGTTADDHPDRRLAELYKTVTADLHDPPDGTHELFLVFRNARQTARC